VKHNLYLPMGKIAIIEQDDSRCRVFTNMAGITCPLCGLTVQPNVEHRCSRGAPESRKPSVRRKEH
jgi:hypothetical protein